MESHRETLQDHADNIGWDEHDKPIIKLTEAVERYRDHSSASEAASALKDVARHVDKSISHNDKVNKSDVDLHKENHERLTAIKEGAKSAMDDLRTRVKAARELRSMRGSTNNAEQLVANDDEYVGEQLAKTTCWMRSPPRI